MNDLTLVTLFLELLFFVCISSHPAGPSLPLCNVEKRRISERTLYCVVNKGQYLDYNKIRTYTSTLSKRVKVKVAINCVNGGRIWLPWPFFAENVVSLHVDGCLNEGLLSERNAKQAKRSLLKRVILTNIRHRVSLTELHDSIVNANNVSKEYYCGLTNAEQQIFKNMQYVFPPPTGSVEELMMIEDLTSKSSLDQLLSSTVVCTFPNLKYLENSGSRSFSTFHLKLMESNQYPKLRVYSLRNNSLGRLPPEIASLQLDFLPNLTRLDLSNNQITSADFQMGRKTGTKSLLISLRDNMIRTLTPKVLQEIQSNRIILDIRENPLECSCDLFSYGAYLAGLNFRIATDIRRGTTCQDATLTQRVLTDKQFELKLCKKLY